MKDKQDLEEYFSDKELIKILCQKRAIIAKKRHDEHFLRNISKNAKSPHKQISNDICSFFPPRSKWIRLDKKEREVRGSNSIEINSLQLERTVWREINQSSKLGKSTRPMWLNNLLEFTNNIRLNVFDSSRNYHFSTPRTIPILKNKVDKTYRPISIFALKDLRTIGQIARYLSNSFDPLFSDSSYAFRTGIQKNKVFNHHKAIEDIVEFKLKINKPLFVSECDIKKFYDCVNHSKVLEEFNKLILKARNKLNIKIDDRAKYFFKSYLNSFSFNINVKRDEKSLLQKSGVTGTIPWVNENELLNVSSNPEIDRIGVPQGGAISCLIANILLDYVDKAIKNVSDENTFYARFCDDMVLMHTEKDKCEELLNIYQDTLKQVSLISHKPSLFCEYGKSFWNESLKSKLPYKWDEYDNSKPVTKTNVPWLSFVGYQIKYNGSVRVRNKSINKELKKQVLETDKIIYLIKKGSSVNKFAVKHRLQQRLISMSVSRFKFGSNKISMCWCAGFKVLKSKSNITNQIRRLDRNREKQIRRLENHLSRVKTPFKLTKKKMLPLKYYGYNYSYSKQFM